MKHANSKTMKYAKDFLEIAFYVLGIIAAIRILLK